MNKLKAYVSITYSVAVFNFVPAVRHTSCNDFEARQICFCLFISLVSINAIQTAHRPSGARNCLHVNTSLASWLLENMKRNK